MKPVVKASIGKTAFILEEEAYNVLKEYLDSLEKHFSSNPSGKEIMEEIEVRLAELLFEKSGSEGVVSVQMACEACDTLGSVKDIDADKSADGQAGQGQGSSDRKSAGKKDRKLFRNPDDKILGGVCSGLAAYFDKDTILFRLIAIGIFLLFALTAARSAFWLPIAAYLALWLAVPEARTVGQRYQMRGEKNTLDSIMENVQNGAREIGDNAKKFNREHPDLLKAFIRAVSVALGILLLLVSFTALLALTVSAAGASVMLPVSLATLLSSLVGPEHVTLCTIALMTCLAIPFIYLLYCGTLMVFKLKAPRWKPGLLLFLIWIAGVGILGYFGVRAAVYFDSGERQFATVEVGQESPNPGELRIVMEDSGRDYDYIYIKADEDFYRLVMIDGDKVYMYPRIMIRRDQDSEDIIIRESTVNFSDKNQKPSFCSYSDGTLTLSPSLLSKGRKIQELGRETIISIPDGMQVRVESPRYHDFAGKQYHTNISLLKDRDIYGLF